MDKRKMAIILLLMIVITVVCINFTIGKVEEKKIETGKINIIDIKEEIEEKIEEEIIENNPPLDTDPVAKEEEVKEKIKDLIVYDKYTNFSSENLKIFTDPYYEFREVIAPGSSNVYHFVVENNLDFDVIYNIEMIEDNDYHINMKYKLRKENSYLIGDEDSWVSASELEVPDSTLLLNSKDNYYLEWIWEESPNDTIIGESIDARYALSISVNVKRADEE